MAFDRSPFFNPRHVRPAQRRKGMVPFYPAAFLKGQTHDPAESTLTDEKPEEKRDEEEGHREERVAALKNESCNTGLREGELPTAGDAPWRHSPSLVVLQEKDSMSFRIACTQLPGLRELAFLRTHHALNI